MRSGAVRVYHQLLIPVNGSESRKKRDELIYFIVRVSSCFSFHFEQLYLSVSDRLCVLFATINDPISLIIVSPIFI
jgi:hypothetical protein